MKVSAMIRKRSLFCVILVVATLAFTSVPASAEWVLEYLNGGAFTQSQDVNVKLSGIKYKFRDVDFKNSFTFGGRGGYWFESIPYFGLAVDVSHFHADTNKQTAIVCSGACVPPVPVAHLDFAVTGISLDAMLRLPLWTSKEFPQGRLQPYLIVGPTVFFARAKGSTLSALVPTSSRSDTDSVIGVQAGAGLAWQFHPNVALFAEYRFTHFDSGFSFPVLGSKAKEEKDINTQRALFGISYRFRLGS
jgi:opacity protein-like surface antigen